MRPIPCFLNTRSGSAATVHEHLGRPADAAEEQPALELRPVEPQALGEAVRRAIADGARRIAVAGGDGTIATAAAEVARAGAELAVIPGGTLNHFAKHLGVPEDAREAATLAARGTHLASVDVGWLNDERLVLNTSSLGAYVNFVRARERLERWLDYYTASFLAGLWTLSRQRRFEVELVVDGEARRYATTMVFISVGEREAERGAATPRPKADRGLHVMVARPGARFHLLRFAAAAYRREQLGEAREAAFDSFVTERVTVRGRRRMATVAVDGELVRVTGAVSYQLQRDALKVVSPERAGA